MLTESQAWKDAFSQMDRQTVTLQCLAMQAVDKHRVPFRGVVLPKHIETQLEAHCSWVSCWNQENHARWQALSKGQKQVSVTDLDFLSSTDKVDFHSFFTRTGDAPPRQPHELHGPH